MAGRTPTDCSSATLFRGVPYEVRQLMQCEFRPGRAWAVSAGGAVAVFAPETQVPMLAAAHALLTAARGANSVAASLERLGAEPFAVIVADSQGARVVRWKDVPLQADDAEVPLAEEFVGVQQLVHATSLEFGKVDELRDGTLPLADGVANVSAVRVTLDRRASQIPGVIARAADIPVDDDTDEIAVFSSDDIAEARRSSSAYADELALALPTGDLVPLDRGVVLGRRPQSSGADGTRPPRLIAVGADSHVVSRNHLALTWDGEHLLAEDLGSTNGTAVTRSGIVTQRLLPGHPMRLQIGDALVLGDGLTVSIGARARERELV